MQVELAKGKYVIAVSGGVDSMTLLDLLSKKPGIQLIVAHFNHGIRDDAVKDEKLVKAAAGGYGLKFESVKATLGPTASEETARVARYQFLENVRQKHQAAAILTAHHQDDLIETAFINLIRGTGRRGLVSILTNQKVNRPLLGYQKQDIIRYAKTHRLLWREDRSNADNSYLRNRIRHQVLPKLSYQQRQELISNIDKVAKIEKIVNPRIAKLSQKIVDDGFIDRKAFTALPIDLANELILFWLRQQAAAAADRKNVKRLNVALRAAKGGTAYDVAAGLRLIVEADSAHFTYTL